jgi:hypothetical protein
MKFRSKWLVGIALVSSAWSQEPGFDLSSDSIKKIVRDVASTQSSTVQLTEETPVKREPYTQIEYSPPAEVRPPLKRADPPRPAAPASDGIVSTLVDILLDGDELDDSSQGSYNESNSCLSKQRYETCPGVDHVGKKPVDPPSNASPGHL